MKKYDDADWHIEDALSIDSARTHIALYFVWLVNSKLIDPKVMKEWSLRTPLDTSKTPSWYLQYYSDDKLLSDYMVSNAVQFTDKFYDLYMEDITADSVIKLDRNPLKPEAYNAEDSWANASVVAAYLNNEYK